MRMEYPDIIFRPAWTCGRYHKESHSALMYNLLAGYAFLFEDKSADAVGALLSFCRGEPVSVNGIQALTGIPVDALKPFLSQLGEVGLVSTIKTDGVIVNRYREQLKEVSLSHERDKSPFEQLTVSQNDSEKAYIRRTKVLVGAAMFELTYNCSEKCIHCYNPGATRNDSEISFRNRPELSFSDYKRIIDDLYDNGLVKVCLTGGDPFSKDCIWEIINYLYNKEIAFEVFTNGQRLMGNEDRLASCFPSDVGVALYGPSAEIHDNVTRINGSFQKSLKVIERLSSLSVPCVIKCTLMRSNVKHYPAMFELAKNLHAELQIECRLFDGLDGDHCISKHLRLTEEELSIVLRDPRLPFYVGTELEEMGAEPIDMDHIACRAGVSNFTITPEGFLIPCCSYHAKIGDLRRGTIREELETNPSYQKLLNTPLSHYEECGRHEYCSFCKMCPGLNYSENGTPLRPSENNCFIAKTRYHVATLLKQGLDPIKGHSIESALMALPDYPHKIISRDIRENYLNNNLSI